MDKTERIEYRDFASVSEAVVHYHKQGFSTFDYCLGTDKRIMRKEVNDRVFEEAMIEHRGLLDVSVSVVRISH